MRFAFALAPFVTGTVRSQTCRPAYAVRASALPASCTVPRCTCGATAAGKQRGNKRGRPIEILGTNKSARGPRAVGRITDLRKHDSPRWIPRKIATVHAHNRARARRQIRARHCTRVALFPLRARELGGYACPDLASCIGYRQRIGACVRVTGNSIMRCAA